MQLAEMEHYAVVIMFLLTLLGLVARWALLEWFAVRDVWRTHTKDDKNQNHN